ncbi:unnamed protein product, partial [Rotaria sp. Silwood1]
STAVNDIVKNNIRVRLAAIEGKGLSEIKPHVEAFIQYAYAIN